MPSSIFINYRRDDAGAEALLVRNALAERFGAEKVFMDTTSIEPGARWPHEIEEKLKAANAIVAVIGPNWLRAGSDEWGRRRIDHEQDWVRRELETVLASRQKLILLFVGGAKPQIPPDVLPESIRELSQIQGISVRRDYWDHDIQLLLANLQAYDEKDSGDVCWISPFPVSDLLAPERLPDGTLSTILDGQLKFWKLIKSPLPENPSIKREELFRELRFRTFIDAIAFMEQVAAGCDIANHHPRWENIFRVVRIYLSTWDANLHAVSDRDVQLARYFDRAYADFPGRAKPKTPA